MIGGRVVRVYLEGKKIYVKNTEGLVYEVKYYEGYDGYDSLDFQLELVCGWDENGWKLADCFDDDVQTESVIQYFFKESLEECLDANEYEILEGNPLEKK